jgi:DNA helicase II / ATP-dependent DNA helicase PcrA
MGRVQYQGSAFQYGDVMDFTKSQLEAIRHDGGNLQLIACAGSGKTEVVARRVAQLLKKGKATGLSPGNIVAFTFTDKAAAELKERISTRCHEELGDINGMAELYVGTIHAYCLELLKSEVPEFLKYGVLNDVQQVLFIDRHSKQSGLTASTDLKGGTLARYVDTPRYVDALSILREARLIEKKLKGCSVRDGLEKYRILLKEKCYLDYSGIMEEALQAIDRDRELKKRLGARIKHVIVDEYQDLNPVQERIVALLHKLGAHICVVGDDDQTLYQWRGSDITNILSFTDRYPAVKQVRLEENFRSSHGIVETARDFIKQNAERLDKAMIPTDAQPFKAGDIIAQSFPDPDAEAVFIANTIKDLRGVAFKEDKDKERGLSYSDCAILLRSVSANAEPIVKALRGAGIPAIVVGMNDLFGATEADAARKTFYFMADANGVNKSDVKAAWLSTNAGLTSANLDKAIQKLVTSKAELNDSDQKRFGVYSLQRVFLTFLEDAELREECVPPGDNGSNRGEVIFYNLGKFSQLISDYETIHYHSKPKEKYDSFAKFLQFQADGAYPEGWQNNQYANPDAVRIMTVHQAKGMQWPVVFMPALLRNRFPSAAMGGRNVWHLIPREGIHGQNRFEGGLEDERRLFYVALTRSQKFLFLTWAPIPGKNNRYTKASQFWDEVLVSKWVKRRLPDYSGRKRLPPQPRAGVSNVVLSFSDMKYFFECPYQFKLRILYGFNAPIHEGLGYGKSLHDALAEVHARSSRGDIPNDGEVNRLVETHLHVPYAYPSLRDTLEASAKGILQAYLKKQRDNLDKVEFSEKTIELKMGDGVSVVGRIDLVRRLDTDETSIVDLKTSERVQAEEVTETQLHIYALGYQELTGRRADYVEIYELDTQKGKPRSVDDEFIDDVKVKVKGAANALRLGQLDAKPSYAVCRTCDYQKMCSKGCSTIASGRGGKG